MRRNYSTPAVSFADRADYRPNRWKPRASALTYSSKHAVAYCDKRGFFVDERTILLMGSWLRGKL